MTGRFPPRSVLSVANAAVAERPWRVVHLQQYSAALLLPPSFYLLMRTLRSVLDPIAPPSPGLLRRVDHPSNLMPNSQRSLFWHTTHPFSCVPVRVTLTPDQLAPQTEQSLR